MKLLQNPIVVGALAVVAMGVVGYQFMGGKPGGRPAAKPKSEAKSAGAKKDKAIDEQPGGKAKEDPKSRTNVVAFLPHRPVDARAIEPRFKSWVDSPPRDPFQILKPLVEDPTVELVPTNSPVPSWRLSATWHQTESRLAVINDRVYRVGETVAEGYKLIRIDEQEVWFQGPHRNERLTFPDPKKKSSLPKSKGTQTKPKAAKRV